MIPICKGSFFTQILFLLLVSISSFGSTLQYCFPAGTSLNAVENHISGFLTKTDSVLQNRSANCLLVETNATKSELFEKLIRRKFRIVNSSYSGVAVKEGINGRKKECVFKLIEESFKNTNTKERTIGSKLSLSDSVGRQKRVSTNSIRALENRNSTLRVGQRDYGFKCSMMGRNLEVTFYRLGTDGSISTSVNLIPGQKLEIGRTLEDLDNKQKTLGIPSGYTKTTKIGQEEKRYFLMVN